ncbi:hypothetical protein J3Q64DRAFT_1771564 [Phycomyces blakesleeanus]|uniref:F-box domain-containing protein n=1 Tax=Phycomyces blakesleeanus TaxID=4837 RepID=A0ABR3ALT2_PHYBL
MPKTIPSIKSSELPYEILSTIAFHLSIEDTLSCTVVSRAWNGPFQDSLWRCISIKRPKTLATILNQFTSGEATYRSSDTCVRSLYIQENACPNDQHMHVLQQRFQKLKDLYIRTHDPDFLHAKIPIDWGLWKSLTNLSIVWMAADGQSVVNEFLKVISHLPQLTQLDLSITVDVESHVFTWKDMEALHDYLPLLEDLTLTAKFGEIKDEDIRQIFFANQASTLRKVCFGYGSWKPFWVLYILRKYPCMHTLEWRAYSNRALSHMDQFELMLILPSLPHAAQYLEVINIQTCSDILYEPVSNGVMLKVLRRDGKDIKEAYFSTVGEGYQNDFYILNRELLRQFLFSNSAALEGFTLDICNTRNTPISWSAFHSCKNLLELNVHALENVSLNDILDHCVSLKKLKLRSPFATSENFVSGNHTIHGLEVLVIEDANISNESMKYLVFRCRQLIELKLRGVRIKTVIPLDNRSISFDVSCLCLQSLELTDVRFYKHTTTFYETTGTRINYIALCLQSQITLPEADITAIATFPSTPDCTKCIWILQCTCSGAGNKHNCTRILRDDEASYCHEYFTMCQKSTMNNNNIQQLHLPKDKPAFIKANRNFNLSTGYVNMLYRHIDRLVIDDLILENTSKV